MINTNTNCLFTYINAHMISSQIITPVNITLKTQAFINATLVSRTISIFQNAEPVLDKILLFIKAQNFGMHYQTELNPVIHWISLRGSWGIIYYCKTYLFLLIDILAVLIVTIICIVHVLILPLHLFFKYSKFIILMISMHDDQLILLSGHLSCLVSPLGV